MNDKYEFKFLAVQEDGDVFDPYSDKQPTLAEYGADGWHIAGTLPSSPRPGFSGTLIIQRKKQTLGEVNIAQAIRDGIYDAFSTWVDEMSVATKRKIFSTNQD